MNDTTHEDPDSDAARLRAHRRLHSWLPEGYKPPPSVADEAMRGAAVLLEQALGAVDRIAAAPAQRYAESAANQDRPYSARRAFTLRDARSDAAYAARLLREAWELLDPKAKP